MSRLHWFVVGRSWQLIDFAAIIFYPENIEPKENIFIRFCAFVLYIEPMFVRCKKQRDGRTIAVQVVESKRQRIVRHMGNVAADDADQLAILKREAERLSCDRRLDCSRTLHSVVQRRPTSTPRELT